MMIGRFILYVNGEPICFSHGDFEITEVDGTLYNRLPNNEWNAAKADAKTINFEEIKTEE